MATLVKPLFKTLGLILAFLGLVILIGQLVFDPTYSKDFYAEKVLSHAHFTIIFGLMMLTFSKEKIDDERVQIIRHFVTKACFRMIVVLIPAYIIVTYLERITFSVQFIFYMIEAVIIFYQVLFRFGLKRNPKIMFSDSTEKSQWFIIAFITIIVFVVVTVIDAVSQIV